MALLIFSHQRCGSSNLTRFLGEGSGCDFGMESLNRKALKKRIPHLEGQTYPQLNRAFTEILSSKPIHKLIYGQHSADIDALAVCNPQVKNILFLYRKDSVSAALSSLLAQRMGHFNKRPKKTIGEIEIADIKLRAKEIKHLTKVAKNICIRSGKDFTEITYEHLFDLNHEQRYSAATTLLVDHICHLEEPPSNMHHAFNKYLDHSKKTNSIETYRFISNIDEILEKWPHLRDAS